LRYPESVVCTIDTAQLQHEGDGKEYAEKRYDYIVGRGTRLNPAAH